MRKVARMLAVLLLAGAALSCGGDASVDDVAIEAEQADGPLSYVAESDTIVLRLNMDRIRRSSLADELGSWLQGHDTWGPALRRAGIDPVEDFDLLLAAAPTSDPAEAIVFARHHLPPDSIRQAVGRVVDEPAGTAWQQVRGFDVARIGLGGDVATAVVLTAANELVVTTVALFDRALRVARDHRERRTGDELIEPALALADGTIATVVARRLNGWARERMPDPPPEALDLRVMDDSPAQDRVLVHANGTYADSAAAAAAADALTEQRDAYADNMLVAAAGLNGAIGGSEIQATGDALDVRVTFTEGDIERVIGMVAMMRQFGR